MRILVVDDYVDGFVVSVPHRSSWILFASREHRDGVNAKVMEDPRMKDMMDPKTMPFDGKRMFWGGFKNVFELPSGSGADRQHTDPGCRRPRAS